MRYSRILRAMIKTFPMEIATLQEVDTVSTWYNFPRSRGCTKCWGQDCVWNTKCYDLGKKKEKPLQPEWCRVGLQLMGKLKPGFLPLLNTIWSRTFSSFRMKWWVPLMWRASLASLGCQKVAFPWHLLLAGSRGSLITIKWKRNSLSLSPLPSDHPVKDWK